MRLVLNRENKGRIFLVIVHVLSMSGATLLLAFGLIGSSEFLVVAVFSAVTILFAICGSHGEFALTGCHWLDILLIDLAYVLFMQQGSFTFGAYVAGLSIVTMVVVYMSLNS